MIHEHEHEHDHDHDATRSLPPTRRAGERARQLPGVFRRSPTQFVCRVLGMNQCRASLLHKQHKQERLGQAAKHHCPAAPRSRIAQTYQARRTPHKLYTSCAEKPSERASTQRGAACPSVQDPPPAATAAAPLTAAAAPDRSSRCSSPHFPPRRRSRTCAPACAAPTRRPGRRRSSRPRLLEGSPPIRFHPT